MDFPKKQAQRLMPLYLLEYSEKLFTNHPNPEDPWGGGSDYTAGQGITITNDEISVNTDVIATKSDIPTNYVTLDTDQTINGFKSFNYGIDIISPNITTKLDVDYDALFFNNFNTKESFSICAFKNNNYGPGFHYSVGAENPQVNNSYMFPHLDLSGEHHYTLATTDDIITSYNDLTDKPTIPTNYVTLDTEQTITGSKTFNSSVDIKLANDTSYLGLENNTLYFDDPSAGETFQMLPYKTLGPGFYFGVGKDALAMNYYKLPHQDSPGEYHYTLATTNDIPSLDGYALKSEVPTTATSTSTSTVTPATGTFVTGTSTNTANVVNSVTYTPSSETLTFTYADNTTASFTFLTSSTTVTSGTTSVVTSVTDSTSNAMTGATVSTSTTTTLS